MNVIDISNKVVFLDLKYEDEDDNFNTGEKRPFLIRKKKENKFHLIPITSREKKRVGPLQKLVSHPDNPTCLTSEEYPYSYANLNRKIILIFEEEEFFADSDFCKKKCLICLPEGIYGRLIDEYRRFWLNPLNLLEEENQNKFLERKNKVKEIRIAFNSIK